MKLGFFKQNAIKSYFQPHLKLGILDVLMCVPLCGIKVYNINVGQSLIFDITIKIAKLYHWINDEPCIYDYDCKVVPCNFFFLIIHMY